MKQKKNFLYLFYEYLLHFSVCGYMLLILVGLPFYNEEGFSHIGTDKAMFFRNVATKCSLLWLGMLAILLGWKLILFLYQTFGPGKQTRELLQQIWLTAKDYWKTKMSATDYFAVLYGISVILAYLFSGYQAEALWGAEGWYMGTLPQLMLVFSYFMISRAWKQSYSMLLVIFPVSLVVFVLGYLNTFGIYPIDMKITAVSFISTIGNINWYCGYLVSVLFLVFYLLWKKDWKGWQKILLMGYVFVGFATLITHGSSSGVVAMAGMLLVTFCLSVSEEKRMEAFWLEVLLLSMACVVTLILRRLGILTVVSEVGIVTLFTDSVLPIWMLCVSMSGFGIVKLWNGKGQYPEKVFKFLAKLACVGTAGILGVYLLLVLFNTVSGGELLEMTLVSKNEIFLFSPEWGSKRGATWTAGIRCFWEQNLLHKLVGVGPDCMAAFLHQNGSEELVSMVKQTFGTARLTNAHNEWLTILVDMGLLGFVGFVGMMTSAIKRYINDGKQHMVIGACGFGLLAYTINNMFSFQQSMSTPTIFVILAVGENYLRNADNRSKV